jgi:hypothetical protein
MRRLCLLCAVARGAAVSMPRLIEAKLARAAVPLAASVDAAADLRSRGVARIDGVLPAVRCAALRLHCGALAERSPDPEAAKWAAWMGAADARYVPGTRLRFGDALEQRLERHRRDVLLPVEDRLVRESLGEAAAAVRGALRGAAGCLPGGGRGGGLELVECGLLASTFGAGHQRLHADFRRDGLLGLRAGDRGAMPPRLVTFVYLQDTPTVAHGPTGFLPGTATAAAHAAAVAPDGAVIADALAGAVAEVATVAAGDAVLYDASVLHWGSSNRTPANERAIFYFGVAAAGAAAARAGPPAAGFEPAPPVRLDDL